MNNWFDIVVSTTCLIFHWSNSYDHMNVRVADRVIWQSLSTRYLMYAKLGYCARGGRLCSADWSEDIRLSFRPLIDHDLILVHFRVDASSPRPRLQYEVDVVVAD